MLINAQTPIANRFYLLYTDDKNAYQRITYSEKLFGKPIYIVTTDIVSFAAMDALLTDGKITKQFVEHFLPIEKLFWDNATAEMKRAAIYSYDYHHRNGNKKIPNVEIANWMTIPFFKNYLDTAFKNARISNIRKPRTTLNAIISLDGKHKISIRLGHFHISYDIINNREIYGVHWDYGLATTSFSILRHWLYDDMAS
jgi:hypothetical protein